MSQSVVFFIIIICICVVAAVFAVRAIRRRQLLKEAEELEESLAEVESFTTTINPDFKTVRTKENLEAECPQVDLEADLEESFRERYIAEEDERKFTEHYREVFSEITRLTRKFEAYDVEVPEGIEKFVRDFGAIHHFVQGHNKRFYDETLERNREFFDHCLKYPLDAQQRRSIVSEEMNCLVVSSAGSGKTSSIVGKVKYLTEIKKVDPRKILLISYTNKAAAELTERIATPGLRGYTFHKLALDLIGKTTGEKPAICDNTDSVFVGIYKELLEQKSFKESIVEYFADGQTPMTEEERRRADRKEKLSEQKKVRLKAMFPDMDGKTVYVRSEQEQKICFVLSVLGVKFRYEEPYEKKVADEMHSQYCPDFSIYFEKDGATQRVYLEHYGVDEHGLVPSWFAEEKGIPYDEANRRYNDGITWKKAVHEKFGTRLIATSSADFRYLDVKEKIKSLLKNAGVPFTEKSDEEVYDLILPKDSKQEKAFIRLIVTFVTLVKSSCKPVEEVLRQAKSNKDERSLQIIQNIFLPVYRRYLEELKKRGQIDFTDAILQATEICRTTHPVEYEHIIVDEFQDISVDRYNFLKALREGNPPAKLYCVGDDWQSIYRFSGSDMALFNQFPEYFGATDVCKIETTYRFGEPLVSHSSNFIQRNKSQLKKDIRPFNPEAKTELVFCAYNRKNYAASLEPIVASIPADKSIFLLGRYSFDDYYLSFTYQSVKERDRFFYLIGGRKIEFLTVHKSKGLEADYVILLQCNKDTYGFPSLVSDDPVLNYVLTDSDQFPYGEERRLFYVAITRAKIKTFVLYDQYLPSVFVDEFLHPERITEASYVMHRNANKRWTRAEDRFLWQLYNEGKSGTLANVRG